MRTLIASLLALIGSVASAATPAQPTTYAVDPVNTRVYWEVRHFGTSTHRGRFDNVSASIVLDPAHQAGELQVTIATGGVDSGVGPLDGLLRGNSFFASATYPKAYFVASRLLFDGERLQEARGEFTLRGVSHPLTLKALKFDCRHDEAAGRDVCGGDFEAEFLRSDYGITFGLPFVGDKVRLVIQVEAVREPAPGAAS